GGEHGVVEMSHDLHVAGEHDEPGVGAFADEDVPRLQRRRTLEQMRGDGALAADDIAIAAFDDMRADDKLELARTGYLCGWSRCWSRSSSGRLRRWCGFRLCGC